RKTLCCGFGLGNGGVPTQILEIAERRVDAREILTKLGVLLLLLLLVVGANLPRREHRERGSRECDLRLGHPVPPCRCARVRSRVAPHPYPRAPGVSKPATPS